MLPPPSGTLLVAWIVLALVLVGLGTLVRRLGRVPAAAGTDPFLDFWTGWAALTVVLEAWHLVLPIDTGALAFVASLGLLGLATDGRRPWRALVRGAGGRIRRAGRSLLRTAPTGRVRPRVRHQSHQSVAGSGGVRAGGRPLRRARRVSHRAPRCAREASRGGVRAARDRRGHREAVI